MEKMKLNEFIIKTDFKKFPNIKVVDAEGNEPVEQVSIVENGKLNHESYELYGDFDVLSELNQLELYEGEDIYQVILDADFNDQSSSVCDDLNNGCVLLFMEFDSHDGDYIGSPNLITLSKNETILGVIQYAIENNLLSNNEELIYTLQDEYHDLVPSTYKGIPSTIVDVAMIQLKNGKAVPFVPKACTKEEYDQYIDGVEEID